MALQNASYFLNPLVAWRSQLQMFLYNFYVSPKGGHAPPKCFLYCHNVHLLYRWSEYGVFILWDYKMLVWKMWNIKQMEAGGNMS